MLGRERVTYETAEKNMACTKANAHAAYNESYYARVRHTIENITITLLATPLLTFSRNIKRGVNV